MIVRVKLALRFGQSVGLDENLVFRPLKPRVLACKASEIHPQHYQADDPGGQKDIH